VKADSQNALGGGGIATGPGAAGARGEHAGEEDEERLQVMDKGAHPPSAGLATISQKS
jgi:hypothetical protein